MERELMRFLFILLMVLVLIVGCSENTATETPTGKPETESNLEVIGTYMGSLCAFGDSSLCDDKIKMELSADGEKFKGTFNTIAGVLSCEPLDSNNMLICRDIDREDGQYFDMDGEISETGFIGIMTETATFPKELTGGEELVSSVKYDLNLVRQ